MSLHSLIRNVGHVSNRQNFEGEFLIILSTAYSDTQVKSVIFCGLDGEGSSFSLLEGTKVSPIFLIFSEKRMQTGPPMTYQTHGVEVSFQKPYLGFYAAHATTF